jgi:expansin (peptidoglycan-binding protein)
VTEPGHRAIGNLWKLGRQARLVFGRAGQAAGLKTQWLGVGAATALAAVLGLVLVLQTTGGAACAATVVPRAVPTGATVHSGQATYYSLGSGTGNCSYPSAPADGRYVALSPGEYAAAGACGGYLDVTGPRGTVRVQVIDQCPGCATGHLDLGRAAFARIADLAAGEVPVTYRAVLDPTLPGPLSLRVKEGSSQYWFALLVIDHGNPLRTVEAAQGNGNFHPLSRADYNYWLAPSGLGTGPFTVRVTDVYGRRATASGIRLQPGTVQKTQTWLYAPGAAPSPTPSRPSPSPSASPSPSSSTVPSPSTVDAALPSAPAVLSRTPACR